MFSRGYTWRLMFCRQRATWINIAREYPGTQVWVIVFDTPYEVCIERLRGRTDHPTIKNPEQGFSILARFRSQYQPPLPWEGHTHLLRLKPSDHPSADYTAESILAILLRLQASELEPAPYMPIESYFTPSGRGTGNASTPRGRAYHPYRGGARGRGYTSNPGWNPRGTPYQRGRAGSRYDSVPQNGSTGQSSSVNSSSGSFPPNRQASQRGSDAQSWRM